MLPLHYSPYFYFPRGRAFLALGAEFYALAGGQREPLEVWRLAVLRGRIVLTSKQAQFGGAFGCLAAMEALSHKNMMQIYE